MPDLIKKFFAWIDPSESQKRLKIIFITLIMIAFILVFVQDLKPVDAQGAVQQFASFEIKPGDGFRMIADALQKANLIRSRFAFEMLAFGSGVASKLKPGLYQLSPEMSSADIVSELVSGTHHEVTVTIPEGASVYDVDRILADANVIPPGSLVAINARMGMEGTLFPDTYKFFTSGSVFDALRKIEENFKAKAAPLLEADKKNWANNLIVASLVEKEVPDLEDQKIVAGIIKKRIEAHMPLQIDATVCYAKEAASYPQVKTCYPLAPLDFKIDSDYNTYLHGSWPPGPIGNPGISALNAALHPKSSSYWFYLSDPKTRKTIFSRTLDEQEQNRVKYLR